MYKKYNRFKKLKVKVIKREGKKKTNPKSEEVKKKENSTECKSPM